MTDTPNRALPVIDERMVVRWRLSYLLSFIIALVGGAIFCTTLWIKVDRLGEDIGDIKAWIRGQFPTRGQTP